MNIGNQDSFTFVLLILTLKSCVKKFRRVEANSVVKYGILQGYKVAFCEDPFGNVIEIYTHVM